uniref:Lipocalin/cytosolic fatty-acid binding domain-containing protein n=1 Tax=Amblyomma maculatum TaxID=34609 RepID=G3MSC5_AMBMU
MKTAVKTISFAAISIIIAFGDYSESLLNTTETSETLIDIKFRNMAKACKKLTSLRLYGVNYNYSESQLDSEAIYKNINVTSTEVVYEKYYFKNKTSIWFIGTFFSTSESSKYNTSINTIYDGVSVQKKGKNSRANYKHGTNYTLLYSDYRSCSILRVPYKRSEQGCHVLLTPISMRKGMWTMCKEMYERACGNMSDFKQVF